MQSKKIMLVEDELIIAEDRCRTLMAFGYEVVKAGSGHEAVEAVESDEDISLVLMDINLGPGIDGIEAAEKILKIRNLPIVFLTAYSTKDYVDRVRSVTRYGYVLKNAGDFVLRSSIEMAFELFEVHQRLENKMELLRKSEAQCRKMHDNLPVPYLELDYEGVLKDVNIRWLKETGYTREEVIGRPFDDFLSDKSINFLKKEKPVLKKETSNFAAELELIKKDGKILTVLFEWEIIDDPDSGVCSIHCVYTDITGRKEMEVRLRETLAESEENRERADRANEAKNIFLANISHEIRTPMNAVIGLTDLAMMSGDDEEKMDYLITVKQSAYHTLDIINELLDLSKIESGKIELKSEIFVPARDLAGIVDILEIETEKKGIYLNFECSEQQKNIRVTGDSKKFKQVVINVIGNAIKFTHKGGVDISLEISETLKNDEDLILLKISVKDSGVGIPPEKIDSVFERFNQVQSGVSKKYGGSGLGLNIVKKIIEQMKGGISVESTPGKGSVFTIEIPFKPAEAGSSEPEDDTVDTGYERQLHILLVDDNSINLKLVSTFLKRSGHVVVAAESGIEAIGLLKENYFDLILMDIEMPGMSGFETVNEIRSGASGSEKSSIPVIAMTAHAYEEMEEKCLNIGMNGFVTKPLDINTLLEEIFRIYMKTA